MSVASAFAEAAADYDRHALVQRRVALKLADHIASLALPAAPRVLEIGCGTGFLSAALIERLPQASWLLTDIAPPMLDRARVRFATRRPGIRFAVMDGERPHSRGSFDLICASLVVQWFNDLPGAVSRLRAQLSPHGRLAFTTLAAGTFVEWRGAHPDASCGIQDYPSPDKLAELGLEVKVERYEQHHAGAREFLRGLKAIGAATPRPGHRPLGPAQLQRVMARFDAAGARATYVVATCVAGALR